MLAARVRASAGAWCLLLVACYLALGSLYALRIPTWQNPDEPAHYNYLHQLATGGGFPVLSMGDYDQAYLERITAANFPPELPVEPLRYEGHQPPLFYLLAAPLDALLSARSVEQRVVAVRLLSLLMGVGSVVFTFAAARVVWPDRLAPAVLAASLPALLPQHLAVAASVNNDALSWSLSAVVVWLTLRVVAEPARLAPARQAALLGLVLGAVLVTKSTAYAALPLPAVALVLLRLSGRPVGLQVLRGLVLAYGLAAVIGAPWFLRNIATYGGLDVLGLARHNAIAVGQPLAQGWELPQLRSLATTLFQSGWLQFGWMTVPAQPWVYGVLAAATGVAGGGMAVAAATLRTWAAPPQRVMLAVAGVLVVLALAEVAYYNLQFLQPQGRYVFAALSGIGLWLAAGALRLALGRGLAWLTGGWMALLVWANWYALTVMVAYLRSLS